MNKPIKARKMWANYHTHCPAPDTFDSKSRAMSWAKSYSTMVKTVPVAVIPLDDVPALVRTAGDAFAASYDGHLCKSDIVAMLTAIGVLAKSKGGRK